MRAPRARSVAIVFLVCLGFAVAASSLPASAQLGAVRADRNGWWNRAAGGGLPLTSPALPFPVPANGLAISASNGEPEKSAAVGIALDVDPARLDRLLLNLGEVADSGANDGAAVAAIRACPIKSSWTEVKGGAWPPPPITGDLASCVVGSRSTDGIWSFDLTGFARRWLSGDLAQNGVLLVEDVNAPSTFQVVVGDRTTTLMTFAADIRAQDDTATTSYGPVEPATSGGSESSGASNATPVQTFEFSGTDSFTVPAIAAATPTTRSTRAPVSVGGGSGVGVLASNRAPSIGRGMPIGLLAIGGLLALGLALVTAITLGPAGDPPLVLLGREGSVSRALTRRNADPPMEARTR